MIVGGYSFGVGAKVHPLNMEGIVKFLTTKKYRKQIDALNNHRAKHGKDLVFSEMKEKLPSLAFGCSFNKGEDGLGIRKQAEALNMSGLLLADIDDGENELTHEEMLECLEALKQNPSTFYADLSSSCKGIHCLLRIPIVKEDIPAYFKHAFRVIAKDFRDDWGISIDTAVSGIQSLKFLGYGKDPYINLKAVEYNIPEYIPPIKVKSNDDRSTDVENAQKFWFSLLNNGLFEEDGTKTLYEETPVRHDWLVRAITALTKQFDLSKEMLENIILPVVYLDTSKAKERKVTSKEVRRIIEWAFELDYTLQDDFNPESKGVKDLPFKDYEL